MKKAVLIILFCIVIPLTGCTEKHDVPSQLSALSDLSDNVDGYIDYPLIDTYFEDGNLWSVIVGDDFFTDSEKYYVSNDTSCLESNKEFINIITFPVGRGITPTGGVYIYKNNVLYKSIPFISMEIVKSEFESAFKTYTRDEIQEIFKLQLPPQI